MESLGYLLFGWLLGLLSPVITRPIERAHRRKEILLGIKSELDELRIKLAGTSYAITLRYGQFNKDFLTSILPIYRAYKGPYSDVNIVAGLESQATLSDADLQKFVALDRQRTTGVALNLKNYRVPYLNSNMGSLDLFSEQTKLILLKINSQLEIFNAEIDQTRFYFALTFDSSVHSGNHEIAVKSFESECLNVSRTALGIVRRIAEFELKN